MASSKQQWEANHKDLLARRDKEEAEAKQHNEAEAKAQLEKFYESRLEQKRALQTKAAQRHEELLREIAANSTPEQVNDWSKVHYIVKTAMAHGHAEEDDGENDLMSRLLIGKAAGTKQPSSPPDPKEQCMIEI